MSATPVRMGVVGAGNWGRNLVRTLDQMGALAGVAEMSPELRARVRAEHPAVPLFAHHDELLATDVQAVLVATPVPTHHGVARAALLAGKDVFVEKPLAFGVTEAQDLVETASKHERVLMVGHLLMYQPAIAWIHAHLHSGALGQLVSLHQDRLNLGTARSAENALWSLGVHDVAVLVHLIGAAPTSLQVVGQRVLQPGIEDDVYLHMMFPGGVHAHVHNSWLWPEKDRRLTVIGTKGMLVYDEIAQTVTLHRKRIEALRNVDEGQGIVFQGAGEPLRLELEHFAECVRTRRAPLSDGKNGLDVVRVLEEASRRLNHP